MWQKSITFLFTYIQQLALFMRKDKSTHMKGRGRERYRQRQISKRSLCSLSSRRSDHRWVSEKNGHLICCPVIFLQSPLPPNLWDLASICSCIFDAFLLTSFFHSACKQARDSFLPLKVPWLSSSHSSFCKTLLLASGYHIPLVYLNLSDLFSFWVPLRCSQIYHLSPHPLLQSASLKTDISILTMISADYVQSIIKILLSSEIYVQKSPHCPCIILNLTK